MRNVKESPRRIDEPIRLANLSMLGGKMSLAQSPHTLLGRLAGDARRSLGGFGGCVRDCRREAGGVLDASGAHLGGHCCCGEQLFPSSQ